MENVDLNELKKRIVEKYHLNEVEKILKGWYLNGK